MDKDQARQEPDELFFQPPPSSVPITPTVPPLRINKTSSPPSRPSSTEAVLDGDTYDDRTSRPNRGPPYPDPDFHSAQPRYTQAATGAVRTPSNSSSEQDRPSAANRRARFAADDPNRPTISGYSKSPPPAALRPGGGRMATPKPLPESTGPETPEKGEDHLFQRAPTRPTFPTQSPQAPLTQPPFQQYYPPPTLSQTTLGPSQSSVNRFASTSTTRAERGSPPPPETPIAPRAVGADVRYALPVTTSGLQAQQAAAAQRLSPYNAPSAIPAVPSPAQAAQSDTRRPWTPTEQPGATPYGPPAVYQGASEVPSTTTNSAALHQQPAPSSRQDPYLAAPRAFPRPIHYHPPSQPSQMMPASARFSFMPQSTAIEQDMGRLTMGEEPPPAYTSVNQPGATTGQGYASDKRSSIGNAPIPSTVVAVSSSNDPNLHRHPAFANAAGPAQTMSPSHPAAAGLAPIQITAPTPTQGPASPPPLPEGWMSHLDQVSGQYYYIHIPTQSTQWEFPKGPTPLKMAEPLSPTNTYVAPLASPAYGAYATQPLVSPGYPPHTPFSPMSSMSAMASPTVAGFTGPPPAAGVDMYKIQPTNGVYFGPYLRYTNMDLERGLWLGSILLVTDVPQPPTIHIHQSVDLSPNPRQLKANLIFSHQRWSFYRFDIDLLMEEYGTKWTYAITSHLGCTRYEFMVAGRCDQSWRFIAHSGNDFALNVNAAERSKLGGVGLMWKDVLQKHAECGGFHAQIGLGGQIHGDRLWREIPALKQWTGISGKENRKNSPWTATHEEDVMHAYFHYYTSHFDQPHVREAFAQIPHVLTLDDSDM